MRPGGRSPFQVKDLPADSSGKLFLMGFLANLLNPKIAATYLSLLLQFIVPANGRILGQAPILGTVQIVISVFVNAMVAISAASIAVFVTQRPTSVLVQRRVMGTVLAGMAVRMATEARR